MGFGIALGGGFATLGNVTIQPLPPVATATASVTVLAGASSAAYSKQAVSSDAVFAAVAASSKASVNLVPRFSFGISKQVHISTLDTRFSDVLPAASARFTAFEQLSSISSTRPEIVTVSEFVPLFSDAATGLTPSGEFLDAQVKLMSLRQQTVATIVANLKKDQQLAAQLDQQEGDFLLHARDLKARVGFLQSVLDKISATSQLLDLRDPSVRVDVKTLLSQYYASAFDGVVAAAEPYQPYSYSDLLVSHGFSRSNAIAFSGTKIFLQTLYEAKKTLRAGSDSLLGVDPSIVGNDVDPSTVNRRSFKDPHVELGKTIFPTLTDLLNSPLNSSDVQLTKTLTLLENGFVGLDTAFASFSEEIAYALKIRTLTREYSYSRTLADPGTVELLQQYGYPISTSAGNQQLFDAVFGQIGNRITDDRSSVNQNAVSSIASKTVDGSSVLTFEADYLANDSGSVFTPGAAYYVRSVTRPSDSGFSLANAADLATRAAAVVDRYVDVLGRFDALPRVGNKLLSQDAATLLASDPDTLIDTTYAMFVEPSTGFLASDVAADPITTFLGYAATDARLRANLLLYAYCASNVAGDGLIDQNVVNEESGNLQDAAFARDSDQNVKVGATLDKLIRNSVVRYELSGDLDSSASIAQSMKNFDEKALISRVVGFVAQIYKVLRADSTAIATTGLTRYSLVSDLCLVALALQIVLDSARRYAYVRQQRNPAFQINANYPTETATDLALVRSTARQLVTPEVAASVQASRGVLPLVTAPSGAALGLGRFASKADLRQTVRDRIDREQDLVVRTAFAPLNAAKVLRDGLQQLTLFLQGADSVATLDAILSVLGDRDLVEMLGERGQVRLISDAVDDLLSRVDPSSSNAQSQNTFDDATLASAVSGEDDLRMIDDTFVSAATSNFVKATFANAAFGTANGGADVRVLSVGLPHGFSTALSSVFKLSAFAEQVALAPKLDDVVVLDLYKVDVRYPDLVFKPVSRAFELSRFVVRDEGRFLVANVGDSLEKVLDSVPTKEYATLANPIVSYGPASVTGDARYAFMTVPDRQDMVRNHVMSYALELYFRIMTGVPASERELFVSDPSDAPSAAPFVTKAILAAAADRVFQVPTKPDLTLDLSRLASVTASTAQTVTRALAPSGASNLAPSKFATTANPVSQFSQTQYAKLIGYASAASDAGKKRTTYSDPAQTAMRLLSPKLFERVFFVAVDPDDFEIDRDETLSSPVGQATFAALDAAGEVVSSATAAGSAQSVAYRLVPIKSQQQELAFEKYFVTVRSYSPSTGIRP